MPFTVEITSNDDGSYTVNSEPEAAEQSEAQGAQPGVPAAAPAAAEPLEAPEGVEDSGGVTVKSVKEALTLALGALKNGGQMPQGSADQDAAFNEGFSGGPAAQAAQ